MVHNRREFLKGVAWMGAAAMAAGCMSAGKKICDSTGAPMHGFRCAPMKKVRVGVIGVGIRGTNAVHRIAQIPGCEVTAISDINPVRLDIVQKWMKENLVLVLLVISTLLILIDFFLFLIMIVGIQLRIVAL